MKDTCRRRASLRQFSSDGSVAWRRPRARARGGKGGGPVSPPARRRGTGSARRPSARATRRSAARRRARPPPRRPPPPRPPRASARAARAPGALRRELVRRGSGPLRSPRRGRALALSVVRMLVHSELDKLVTTSVTESFDSRDDTRFVATRPMRPRSRSVIEHIICACRQI